ncbi:hypothetical protein Ahy_Scaffold1g106687 isoform B [Arachis hypogaea]|uniref:MADS-box protein n=1 Tax=Arachis hypogaea TaxID=3818 RepID=A0A444WRA6_ARAHY|nr:hypothetical protein Ahy_Scaffold1g106687 isoform B [Arachis hypogaea]
MGRGKIEIKLIENPTNRQVTYSKRRNGIFKKAHELSVLCDAKVSLIMFSKNNKMHEYISPGLSTKKIIDQYQKTLGDIDLWHSHYEFSVQKMLENLKKLKDINNKLRRQIRNRIGEGSLDMDDMSFQQLRTLEEDMVSAIAKIRERKVMNYMCFSLITAGSKTSLQFLYFTYFSSNSKFKLKSKLNNNTLF